MDSVYKAVLSLLPELSQDDIGDNEEDYLFWGAVVGDASALRECLSRGQYEINRRVHRNRSAIMAAAWRGEQTIYHVLMSEGAELTYVDDDGNNCLHLAAEGGNESIVNDLLSWDLLNINTRGYLGQTALHKAALNGNEEVFGLLLKADADLTFTDDQGNNCLHLAAARGNKFIVKATLLKDVLDINSRGYLGRTAVFMAVFNDHVNVVDILVSKEAELSIRTENNNDCLLSALVTGNTSMLRKLLDMKDMDINSRGQHGRTPVMTAALLGKLEEFDILNSAKGNLSIQDEFGNDCMLLASAGGCLDVVQNLVSLNLFDINRQQENGITPVRAAASGGHQEVFEYLVSQGAELTATSSGNSCLIMACEGGNVHIVDKLIFMGVEDINQQGQNGWAPIMISVIKGEMEIFKNISAADADLSLVDDSNNNCLILAAIYGQEMMIEHLLNLDNVFNINQCGYKGMTAVMAAAHEGNEEVFDMLVNAEADLTLLDEYDSNCLILASIGGNASIVQKLLDTKSFEKDYYGNDGWTALSAAAITGNKGVFEILLGAGADATICDKDNDNLLMLAVIGGETDIVQKLISMNVFDVNAIGGRGWTAAMFASFYGNTEILGVLLVAGTDVTLPDVFNNNCLILATANGHTDTVKRLLEEVSVDINCRGMKACTPILLAAHGGHKEIIELLLSRNADLAVVDENGASFIHYTTNVIKEIVRDVPAIKHQIISELKGSFMRTSSFRGSFRGSFIGKE